jgi:nicotinate phosphoribosyltransferase
MPIINSMLDNDMYKFTMQKAVLGYKQGVPVQYVFNNRRPEGKFNMRFLQAFEQELDAIRQVALQPAEAQWFLEQCPFLGHDYIAYLRDYRYDPNEVSYKLTSDGELELDINGPWERTILWEVPLMAIISELFFIHCDTDWKLSDIDYAAQHERKATTLHDCMWADFGTRRRRCYQTQDIVVGTSVGKSGFVGTSNVHLARKHGVKPIGTMAHEWIMGISALEGLRYANRHALRIWSQIFNGNLGIALTDTFGTPAFFEDFDLTLSKLYDGVRHDSGEWGTFANNVIAHYKGLGIDPTTKTIVFSDGLTSSIAASINGAFRDLIRCSFGIGTHFTNDSAYFGDSKALNMVIKLYMCNGIPVVKLSDVFGKQIGDKDALRVANWTFRGQQLDTPLKTCKQVRPTK